jgi:hypothetical protein
MTHLDLLDNLRKGAFLRQEIDLDWCRFDLRIGRAFLAIPARPWPIIARGTSGARISRALAFAMASRAPCRAAGSVTPGAIFLWTAPRPVISPGIASVAVTTIPELLPLVVGVPVRWLGLLEPIRRQTKI